MLLEMYLCQLVELFPVLLMQFIIVSVMKAQVGHFWDKFKYNLSHVSSIA